MIRSAIRRVLGLTDAAAGSSVGPGDSLGHVGPFPVFRITDSEGNDYLTRYYLLKSRWVKVYLHAIHKSDDDRALHDHPWRFVSLLLKGPGYIEHQPDGTRKRFYSLWGGAVWRLIDLVTQHRIPPDHGCLNIRWDPAEPHRLECVTSDVQWTLVLVGPKRREWGFHVPDQDIDGQMVGASMDRSNYVKNASWVDHKSFLDIKFGPDGWLKEPFYYEEEIRA